MSLWFNKETLNNSTAEVVEVTSISGITWIKRNIIDDTLQIHLSASFSGESQIYRSTNLSAARESVFAQGHFSVAVICTLNLYCFHICYITNLKSAQTLKSTLTVTEKETVLINTECAEHLQQRDTGHALSINLSCVHRRRHAFVTQ